MQTQDVVPGDTRELVDRAGRAYEELHRTALAHVSDTVFLTDAQGRFTYVSPNVELVFGYSPDEVATAGRISALLGENLFDPAALAQLRELRNIERDVTLKSGERRTVRVHVKAVWLGGGTVLYCCRDVTDLKQAEEQVRCLRGELAHVARLALVGQLMASITHEVKQPLTAIVGNAAAALEALESGASHPHADELREMLRDIAAESRLAAELVDRVRALSRNRPLHFERVDLNDVAAEAMQFLTSEARRRHVALCSDFEPSLPAVRADRASMQQVLLSLALNAMDAMDGVEGPLRRLVLRTRRLDDGVELSVSDHGGGISEGALSGLFEAFYTTKSRGLGLGLTVARSLVDAHHGRIWANNDAIGATFHVALPALARNGRAPWRKII